MLMGAKNVDAVVFYLNDLSVLRTGLLFELKIGGDATTRVRGQFNNSNMSGTKATILILPDLLRLFCPTARA